MITTRNLKQFADELDRNDYACYALNRASNALQGHTVELSGEPVADQVLRLGYLRDEGRARERYARARGTF